MNSRKYLVALLCICIYQIGSVHGSDHKNRLFLKGYITTGQMQPDTVTLYLWGEITSEIHCYMNPHRIYRCVVENNRFSFTIDSIPELAYVTLSNDKNKGTPIAFMDRYYAARGDSISIFITPQGIRGNVNKLSDSDNPIVNYHLRFTGRGGTKYQAQFELDSLVNVLRKDPLRKYIDFNQMSKAEATKLSFDKADFIVNHMVRYLEYYKTDIAPEIYKIMYADIIAQNCNRLVAKQVLYKSRVYLASDWNKVRDFYKNNNIIQKFEAIPHPVAARSKTYILACLSKCEAESKLLYKNTSVYQIIVNDFRGLLRDKLLTTYLLREYKFMGNDVVKKLLNNALQMVQSQQCLSLLQSLNQLNIGARMPDFALPDPSGKIIRLEDYKGKVVFMDFYFTGCSGCINYFKNSVSKAEKHFRDNPDVVFISVSIDGNRNTWLRSLSQGIYTSEHAVNVYTAGQGGHHPLIKKLFINSYPHPILIDCDGRIYNNSYYELGPGNPAALIAIIERALSECKK